MRTDVRLDKTRHFFRSLFSLAASFFLLTSSVAALTSDEEGFTKNFCYTFQAKNKFNSQNNNISHQYGSDLGAILERGTLRILIQKKNDDCIINKTEKLLIEEFANTHDLKIHWSYVNNEWELVTELITGSVDVVVGQNQNLALGLHNKINFAHAWTSASYKIVQRRDNSRINRVQDLTGRHVAAYKSSSVWNYLVELSRTQIGMTLQEIPKFDSHRKILERVKTGQYDLAVVDSLFIDQYLTANNELQTSLSISDERNMAWAVKSDAKELRKALNQYLNQQYHTHNVASTHIDDLSAIKNRGYLRVITNANSEHYYLNNGNLNGFEYELLRDFASNNQMRVDVVIATSKQEMFKLLQEGKGDVIAASLATNFLEHDDSFKYTKPYDYASPVVIGRKKDQLIVDARDLIGKRISISRDNPYWNYMSRLKEQGIDFELIEADTEDIATIMLQVAVGIYDFTIAGSHQIKFSQMKELGLDAKFVLFEPLAHRWVVRTDSSRLHNALNEFIKREYRGVKYNLLHAKYFEQPKQTSSENQLVKVDSLSPYDEEAKHYSTKYGFDWRLIIALMFQESRFNPNANSYAGAKGVMQLTKATAKLMGLNDTKNVEKSIDAGVRYLSYLRGKFDNSIILHDRMWFAVAAYNSGYTRLKRARKLAEEMGLDKDKWFKNVELAMLLMAKPYKKNGKRIRNCRCGQTVVYVREIRTRYFNYIRLTETQQLAMRPYINRKRQQIN